MQEQLYSYNNENYDVSKIVIMLNDDSISIGDICVEIHKLFNTNHMKTIEIIFDDIITKFCPEKEYRSFKAFDEYVENLTPTPQPTNIPKCPTCQSTNIKKISTTSKAVSVGLFGLFSQKVKRQFCCENCGYEW